MKAFYRDLNKNLLKILRSGEVLTTEEAYLKTEFGLQSCYRSLLHLEKIGKVKKVDPAESTDYRVFQWQINMQ